MDRDPARRPEKRRCSAREVRSLPRTRRTRASPPGVPDAFTHARDPRVPTGPRELHTWFASWPGRPEQVGSPSAAPRRTTSRTREGAPSPALVIKTRVSPGPLTAPSLCDRAVAEDSRHYTCGLSSAQQLVVRAPVHPASSGSGTFKRPGASIMSVGTCALSPCRLRCYTCVVTRRVRRSGPPRGRCVTNTFAGPENQRTMAEPRGPVDDLCGTIGACS